MCTFPSGEAFLTPLTRREGEKGTVPRSINPVEKNGTPGFPGASSFEEQDRISSSQGAEHFEGKLVRDGEI